MKNLDKTNSSVEVPEIDPVASESDSKLSQSGCLSRVFFMLAIACLALFFIVENSLGTACIAAMAVFGVLSFILGDRAKKQQAQSLEN